MTDNASDGVVAVTERDGMNAATYTEQLRQEIESQRFRDALDDPDSDLRKWLEEALAKVPAKDKFSQWWVKYKVSDDEEGLIYVTGTTYTEEQIRKLDVVVLREFRPREYYAAVWLNQIIPLLREIQKSNVILPVHLGVRILNLISAYDSREKD